MISRTKIWEVGLTQHSDLVKDQIRMAVWL
jgi:hypothetical protein